VKESSCFAGTAISHHPYSNPVNFLLTIGPLQFLHQFATIPTIKIQDQAAAQAIVIATVPSTVKPTVPTSITAEPHVPQTLTAATAHFVPIDQKPSPFVAVTSVKLTMAVPHPTHHQARREV